MAATEHRGDRLRAPGRVRRGRHLEGPITKWLSEHPGPFLLEDLFAKDTGITPYRETTAVTKRDEMRAARCLIKLWLIKRQQTINGRRGIWWTRK